MKVYAPKFFRETASMVKDFYFPKYVKIASSYSEDSVTKALFKLEDSKDIFEKYAKHNGVFLSIDRADSILLKGSVENKDLKKAIDRSVLVTVTDGITGKERSSVIDTTKVLFIHKGAKYVSHNTPDGSSKVVKEAYSYEDNFLRAVYRVVGYLTKLVKS